MSADGERLEGDVGYGKPPRRSQFKKGQSGNPKGRKKKVADAPPVDSEQTVYERYMMALVAVTENGQPMMLTAREIIFRRLIAMAMAGDKQAVLQVMKLEEKFGHLRPPKDPDDEFKGGVLVVPAPVNEEEWLDRTCGRRIQPSLPILEQFREELGMPLTNQHFEGDEVALPAGIRRSEYNKRMAEKAEAEAAEAAAKRG